MSISPLSFVWDEHGHAQFQRVDHVFLRTYPSNFSRDLRLRFPGQKMEASKPLFLCRHAASLQEEPAVLGEPEVKLSQSLVKSNLQKAVRRGQVDAAVASAAYLLASNPEDLLRRLPVVVAEDVSVSADLAELTWLMLAVQKGYALRMSDVRLILSVVAAAAAHPYRIEHGRLLSVAQAASAAGSLDALCGQGLCPLRWSLGIRACHGGMEGDVKMLLACAFAPENWKSTLIPRASLLPPDQVLHALKSPGLLASHRLPESVDFHVSEIVPHIVGLLRVRGDVDTTPTMVHEAIWVHRSSVNFRDRESKGSSQPSWWDGKLEEAMTDFSKRKWATVVDPVDPTPSRKRPKAQQLSMFRFVKAKAE